MKTFLASNLCDAEFIMLMNVKITTIVAILTFMSMIMFMLNLVEHGKSVMTFEPGLEVIFVILCPTQLNMKFILLLVF